MITKLHIENYILINSLDLTLESGLNTITGETGAGKSILLGAVTLILGGRGDNSLIKNGAKNLVLEAEFEVGRIEEILKPIFEEEDIEFSQQLTIRRIISQAGKSKSYINDEPVTQSFLKLIGGFLVDIHSQHRTMLLSVASFQTDLLDSYAVNGDKLLEYRNNYSSWLSLKTKIAKIKEELEQSKRDRDYIEFQFEQLATANLIEGEQEELERERDILSNATAISETLYAANYQLSACETNIIGYIQSINSSVDRIAHLIPAGEEIVARLSSVSLELKDIDRELEIIASNTENNPSTLAEIEERLDLLNTLQHKHHVATVEELIELRNSYDEKLSDMDSGDYMIEEMEAELDVLEKKAWATALQIRERRVAASTNLSTEVVSYLSELGMPNANLIVEVKTTDKLGGDGADAISFLFSANKGQKPEPIDKVASGGEMSRLMLSLKVIAAEGGTLPTIIFDEIDSGVSGKVADMMGNLIERLSAKVQIINITHLPQIASKGEHHFFVYKEHGEGESYSHIVKLTEEERIKEIAVMISGDTITEAAINQAKLLIKK